MQSSASAVQLLEFILRVKQLHLQYPLAAGTWHLLPPLRQHPLLPQLRQHQPQRCVPEVLSLKSAISCHYDVRIPFVLLYFCTQTVFLGGFDVQADVMKMMMMMMMCRQMMMILIYSEKRQRKKQQQLRSMKHPKRQQGPRRRRVSLFFLFADF